MTLDRDNARALIASARERGSDRDRYDPLLTMQLADALEAALSAVPAEPECRHGGELIRKLDGGRCSMLCPDCDRIVGTYRRAVPVEGDREALLAAIQGADPEDHASITDSVADAILAAGFSRSPLPVEGEVEWEYRAKVGHIYGEPRADYENAVLAAEEAYAVYSFEVEDESITVYRRPRIDWEVVPDGN